MLCFRQNAFITHVHIILCVYFYIYFVVEHGTCVDCTKCRLKSLFMEKILIITIVMDRNRDRDDNLNVLPEFNKNGG